MIGGTGGKYIGHGQGILLKMIRGLLKISFIQQTPNFKNGLLFL